MSEIDETGADNAALIDDQAYWSTPAMFAHYGWMQRLSPAVTSETLVTRLTHSQRVGARFATLIRERFDLVDSQVEDMSSDGRSFLLAPPEMLEERLLFLGAVARGPALRMAVSRLAIGALVEVLGESRLRAAVRAGELGEDETPLDTTSAAAVRKQFAESASSHFAAWLARQPEQIRKRALLGIAPKSDLAPKSPEKGDPDFVPMVAPLFKHFEGRP